MATIPWLAYTSNDPCGGSMPSPYYQTLMVSVLNAASGGEVRISDVVERLAD